MVLRTVVLRAADKLHSRLELHTNLLSSKITDLMATPVTALHVWDSGWFPETTPYQTGLRTLLDQSPMQGNPCFGRLAQDSLRSR